MSQIFLKLLVCFLLMTSVTAQYNTGQYHGAKLLSTGQTDPYNPGYSSVASNSDDLTFYNQLLAGYTQAWPQNTGLYGYTQQPAQSTVTQEPATSKTASIQRDYNDNRNSIRASPNNEYPNRNPYNEPTGPPYGFRSTGVVLNYKPEKLDLTKCGPQPTSNPCKIFGPPYHALPGYPDCYIHCAFGRMFVKPCPTDLTWNPLINTCDWKTIAPDGSDSKEDALVYDNGRKENTWDLYKKNKRSTIERKKRNIMYNSPQNQGLAVGQKRQFQNYYSLQNLELLSKPLTVPLTPVHLPGPVSYPGRFGIPSLYMPTATNQQFFSSPTTPQAAPSAGVAQPTQQPQYPYGAEFNYPMRRNYETTNPTGAPTNVTETPGGSAIPPSTADANQNTETPNEQIKSPQAPLGNIPVGYNDPMAMFQGNPTSFNPYVAPNPIPTQVTLIPGPLYPYGPPFGGPFGGPPSKQVPAQKSASKKTSTNKEKINGNGNTNIYFGGDQAFSSGASNNQPAQLDEDTGTQLPPFLRFFNHESSSYAPLSTVADVPLVAILNDPSYRQDKQKMSSIIALMKKAGWLKGYGSTPTEKTGSSLRQPVSYDDDDEDDDDGEDYDDEDEDNPDRDHADSVDNEDYEDEDSDEAASDENRNDDSEETKNDDEEQNDEENDDEEASKQNSKPNKFIYQFEIHLRNPIDKNNGNALPRLKLQRKKREYSPLKSDSEQQSAQLVNKHKRATENKLLSRSASFTLSPCLTKPRESYTAHPTDNTKYIACFNQFYYRIMNCPSSLIYDPIKNKCEKRKGLESLCEREKPCKNAGICHQTGPKSFKCTCRGDWTGDRCEKPLSTCASKPCGLENECITIRTSNTRQDYVCVCNEGKSYGLNCQRDLRPNPCLSSRNEHEQYYPFEFSNQAFIQCNGDILYVQPCPSGLLWNATQQVCDVAVTEPPKVHEYQPEYEEAILNDEQQKQLTTPPLPASENKPGQKSLPNTFFQIDDVDIQRNLPTENNMETKYPANRSPRPVTPPRIPDAIRVQRPNPRYDDRFHDT